jgi:hypothetical protein
MTHLGLQSIHSKKSTLELINKLLALKERGIITDAELSLLLTYIGNEYVEAELDRKLRQVFGKIYSSINLEASYA